MARAYSFHPLDLFPLQLIVLDVLHSVFGGILDIFGGALGVLTQLARRIRRGSFSVFDPVSEFSVVA